ncbi:hypothetical protein L7F22_024780 [Adiantum nelumboides]|nr:hypothetical protein [Adiantum nelumboides]
MGACIVKAKLPFDFLGFPVHAGFKACGHIQELALRLSCCAQLEAGPSVEVAYRPHEQDRPFTLSFKTGFSPWPSSPASALTMTAEFNLSRLSNPTYLLRVKPQLGDFSICHDFRTAMFGSGAASNDNERRQDHHESSSDTGFTNAFARYATKLCLSESSRFPWHDASRNEICDASHRYDVASNANVASFDSTPYASERASFSMFDLVNFRSECPTPVCMSTEEKRFPDMGQHTNANTGWAPVGDKMQSRNLAVMPRTDDGWDHAVDGASQTLTSASSSTLQSRDDDPMRVQRCSQSNGLLAGWVSRGFPGSGHLHACTRLPISPEAQFRIRWSLSMSSSPSLSPLLLMDKVTLEAAAPSTSTCRTPLLPNSLNADRQLEDVAHLERVESLTILRARENSLLDGRSTNAGVEGELEQGHEPHTKNGGAKKPFFFGRFLHGKGLLD